jgi:hypothetical protein
LKNGWERKAEQLLKDARGRAALKKFGIEVEIAGKDEVKDKPIVAILCPTYRTPEPEMKESLLHMCQHTNASGVATVYAGPPCSASVVHWSRNWLVGEQLKSGKPWTHVLFIDDDIVVEPEALNKLLSHKKDIVAGICTRRNDPPIPNIRFYDKAEGATRQIWEWPENQLIEVDAVGTGLMLISKNALEQVAEAYFSCVWEQDFYGMSADRVERVKKERLAKFDAEKICYWFRFLPTERGDIEMGEDVTFCYLAKKYCGLSIYVDTSVQPGHLGPYPFGIKDFIPYKDLCIERAKREGTYKVQPKLEAEIQVVG